MPLKPCFQVLGLGEVLWDLLPSGAQLGGAPANFSCHTAALGANADLISQVGRDALGEEAMRRLRHRGFKLAGITVDPDRPTGTVAVTVDSDGHPRFKIAENSAWDGIRATPEAQEVVSAAAAICFGSLGQRTRGGSAAIQQLVAATRPRALRVFDVNLRTPFYTERVITQSLELANVLKLNETELPVLSEYYRLSGSPEKQLETLANRFELNVVALTLGAAGSKLWRDGVWTAEPARPVIVKDAVGAGDSFTAALVMGLLHQWETPALLAAASEISAFVCTQPGATPDLPTRFLERFQSQAHATAR